MSTLTLYSVALPQKILPFTAASKKMHFKNEIGACLEKDVVLNSSESLNRWMLFFLILETLKVVLKYTDIARFFNAKLWFEHN